MNARIDHGDTVVITLKTGEEIRVTECEHLGVTGYDLKVLTTRGALLVMPESGNSMRVSTPRAMERLEREIESVVEERDRNKAK